MIKTVETSNALQPLPPKLIVLFLSISIVLTAITAGYYHELYQQALRKNSQLSAKILDLSLFCPKTE